MPYLTPLTTAGIIFDSTCVTFGINTSKVDIFPGSTSSFVSVVIFLPIVVQKWEKTSI